MIRSGDLIIFGKSNTDRFSNFVGLLLSQFFTNSLLLASSRDKVELLGKLKIQRILIGKSYLNAQKMLNRIDPMFFLLRRRSAEEAFRSLVKTHEKYGWVTPALSDG